MGILRSIADSFDKSDTKKSFIDGGSLLSSGRFIALAGIIALAIFKLCEPATMTTLLWAFGIYTVGNTVTRTAQIIMDGLIHKHTAPPAVTAASAP
jgi:hypothetical protein